MEQLFPLLFAGVIGFTHAFEADHLVAVGNIVSKRDRMVLAVKDGIYWGLGHTSTIILIGILFILVRIQLPESFFGYCEVVVGFMLIGLGVFRLVKQRRQPDSSENIDSRDNHQLAYGVGLVHGLAGSGALVLLVMTEMSGPVREIAYLFIFGLGSVLGMLIVAGLFSLPFSQKYTRQPKWQNGLMNGSALLCMAYGTWMVYHFLA